MIIHVGIDTVKLDGKGFDVKVETGAHVDKGDVLMQRDLDFLREKCTIYSISCYLYRAQGKSEHQTYKRRRNQGR